MARRWAHLLLVLSLGACSQSDFGSFPIPDNLPETPEGPGDPAWGNSDISCQTQDDCAPNESCDGNVCMPTRCTDGPYDSQSPLGRLYLFYHDQEVLAADASSTQGYYWIDSYSPSGSSLSYMSGDSFRAGPAPIVDVAGGNVLGERPDAAVAVVAGSATVNVRHPSGDRTLSLTFQPIAVATGDVDQDSIDEIIAMSSSGKYAICEADQGDCEEGLVPGVTHAFDVTAGDVDGDGYDEPVFHVERNGDEGLWALNPNYQDSGEPQWLGGTSHEYAAISAGIVDSSGRAKVIGLRDGGYWGWASDKLETVEIDATSVKSLGSVDVDAESRDVELADTDMDGRAEIGLLYGDNTVELRRAVAATSQQVLVTRTLSSTGSPSRIGFADVDGDSPIATQISGPELIPGGIAPTIAMEFPPYSQTFSDTPSYLFVGRTENITENYTDSMAVRYGVGIGFETKIANVVRAGITTRFGHEWSQRHTIAKSYTIGARISITPDTALYGNDFSVVMLSSGCFHAYAYRIDDPRGALDPSLDGSVMAMMVPVGGQMSVWSSMRYNALARHLGNLPIIETPVAIGDPSSYPSTPSTIEGGPIQAADLVFPYTPSYKVSDVGVVGFWLSASDSETNEQSTSIDLAGYGNVGVGPVTVNVDVGLNEGHSHALTIGKEAIFGGGVPAVPDDPGTPEDEHADNGFAYSPFVYREHYTDASGNEAGYYVLSFTVSK